MPLHLYIDRLVDVLEKSLKADEPLEVSTYTSQDLEDVRYAAERFSGARLRLQTRIDIKGDTQQVLPEEKGDVDPAFVELSYGNGAPGTGQPPRAAQDAGSGRFRAGSRSRPADW